MEGFFEWIPNPSSFFSVDSLDIHPGDEVQISITVHDSGHASALIQNETRLKGMDAEMTSATTLNNPLCQSNAEWIVEDFSVPNAGPSGNIAMANFSPIKWTNGYATIKNGSQIPMYDFDEVFGLALSDEGGRVGAMPDKITFPNNVSEWWVYYTPGIGRPNQTWPGEDPVTPT